MTENLWLTLTFHNLPVNVPIRPGMARNSRMIDSAAPRIPQTKRARKNKEAGDWFSKIILLFRHLKWRWLPENICVFFLRGNRLPTNTSTPAGAHLREQARTSALARAHHTQAHLHEQLARARTLRDHTCTAGATRTSTLARTDLHEHLARARLRFRSCTSTTCTCSHEQTCTSTLVRATSHKRTCPSKLKHTCTSKLVLARASLYEHTFANALARAISHARSRQWTRSSTLARTSSLEHTCTTTLAWANSGVPYTCMSKLVRASLREHTCTSTLAQAYLHEQFRASILARATPANTLAWEKLNNVFWLRRRGGTEPALQNGALYADLRGQCPKTEYMFVQLLVGRLFAYFKWIEELRNRETFLLRLLLHTLAAFHLMQSNTSFNKMQYVYRKLPNSPPVLLLTLFRFISWSDETLFGVIVENWQNMDLYPILVQIKVVLDTELTLGMFFGFLPRDSSCLRRMVQQATLLATIRSKVAQWRAILMEKFDLKWVPLASVLLWLPPNRFSRHPQWQWSSRRYSEDPSSLSSRGNFPILSRDPSF